MIHLRSSMLTVGMLASSFLFGSRASAGEMIAWSGATMGTRYNVKVYVDSADNIDAKSLQAKVDRELRAVNDEMSTYLKSSEISRFNDSDSTEWFDVSQSFADVVRFAQSVSKATSGAFDVTLAPLVNIWNFGPQQQAQQIPSQGDIAAARRFIGYKKLQVRTDPPQLKKQIPELSIDLSAIAKGHGVDRVIQTVRDAGFEDAFVEIGGEVRTSGDKDGQWWKVGIQVPDAKSNQYDIAYSLSTDGDRDSSMATSGDYRNFIEVDGKRYSHMIDPRTGRPIEHNLASVSVVASSCMKADVWATALNVLGPDEGQVIAKSEGLDALLVSRTETGFQRIGVGTMAKYASQKAVAEGTIAQVQTPAGSQMLALAGITFIAFAVILFAMAVGVIFGKKSISGSCGGLASAKNEDGSVSCSLCSNPADACKELREKMTKHPTTPL